MSTQRDWRGAASAEHQTAASPSLTPGAADGPTSRSRPAGPLAQDHFRRPGRGRAGRRHRRAPDLLQPSFERPRRRQRLPTAGNARPAFVRPSGPAPTLFPGLKGHVLPAYDGGFRGGVNVAGAHDGGPGASAHAGNNQLFYRSEGLALRGLAAQPGAGPASRGQGGRGRGRVRRGIRRPRRLPGLGATVCRRDPDQAGEGRPATSAGRAARLVDRASPLPEPPDRA